MVIDLSAVSKSMVGYTVHTHNDLVVLMADIPDFRVSMDLLPKHDDLQEPKVYNIRWNITDPGYI
jgi:hypothetical protein